MARISEVERPGLAGRVFYSIGRRLFGRIPTPERIMAHRMPLMLGMGALYGAIEWFGKLERELRALVQLEVARVARAPY